LAAKLCCFLNPFVRVTRSEFLNNRRKLYPNSGYENFDFTADPMKLVSSFFNADEELKFNPSSNFYKEGFPIKGKV
jgi:hypothetical protein